MEDVAELVARLESRGVRFHADALGVRFEVEDAGCLVPGDPAAISELVLERTEEVLEFLARRARPAEFGQYAAAFRSLACRLRTPAGMLPWLRVRCPRLYGDLTGRLPDAVQRLWEQHASMEEFVAAVRRLEESHRAARGFYEACREGVTK